MCRKFLILLMVVILSNSAFAHPIKISNDTRIRWTNRIPRTIF